MRIAGLIRRLAVLVGTAAIGLLAARLARAFRRDLGLLHAKVDRDPVRRSRTVPAVEYLDIGSGPPVLVVHGIWGGFDQGVINAGHALDRFRRIFVSRFGYLGSDLPLAATVGMQADAFARLLDELDLDRVAVVAHSAGSTSAIEFAIRHPDRVSALVLVSPAAPGPVEVELPPRWLAEILFRSDFLFWLLVRFASPLIERMMGVPKGYKVAATDRPLLRELAASVLPVSRRYRGALFDMFESNPAVQSAQIEKIAVPVLVVAAKDDPLALYENSRNLVDRIRGAELHLVEAGGHVLLGHTAEIEDRIAAFLAAATGGQPSRARRPRRPKPGAAGETS